MSVIEFIHPPAVGGERENDSLMNVAMDFEMGRLPAVYLIATRLDGTLRVMEFTRPTPALGSAPEPFSRYG